jgi:hypothetical protein
MNLGIMGNKEISGLYGYVELSRVYYTVLNGFYNIMIIDFIIFLLIIL